MSEVVRRLKINRLYVASTCAWCGDMLVLGANGAVCEACETPHHEECWEKENGCGQADCINAPLRQAPDPVADEGPLAANEIRCPHCQAVLSAGAIKCSSCKQFTTLSGLYVGPLKISSQANEALLYGLAAVLLPPLISLVFFNANLSRLTFIPALVGLQCGGSAWSKGRSAIDQIAHDQTLKGRGLAITAQILGGIGIAIPVLSFISLILLLVGGR